MIQGGVDELFSVVGSVGSSGNRSSHPTRRSRSTTRVSSNLTKARLPFTEPNEIQQRTDVLASYLEYFAY
ncbi:hypothetical protein ONZ45_g11960 [Pleurotus djamor]|nr:hypothetical protein ONZ45_g11960 [Pleurotus djamor]